MKTNDIISIGNVLMDFLVEVDDRKLLEFNLKKGEMHLVDEEKARELLNKIQQYETVPGGSAANTVRGFAHLGGKAILYGKVGKDEHGENYIKEIENHGVCSRISTDDSITGHALTLMTPDAERTFSVHLGAATKLSKSDILEEDIQKSKILYLSAFELEEPTRETVLHAITIAKEHNTLVALDLADSGVIRRNKEFLKELVKDVDLVFANEQEAKELTGLEGDEAVRELGKNVKIAVVKLGEKGSLICFNDEIIKVNAFLANAIDTTGAGDTYAAGFLYGYCNNWSLEKSGKLGSLFAAKVVEQKGVKIKGLDVESIKGYLE